MMSVDEADQESPEHSLEQARNPFDGAAALRHSNYCYFDGTRLKRCETQTQVRSSSACSWGEPPTATAFVHDAFRALILNEHFTCVGAKAAVRQGAYRFGLYETLASADSC